MLKGKRIVVLGGTAGIGFAVAERAAAEGARAIVASSNRTRVDQAVAKLSGAEGRVLDLRSEDAIRAFFDELGAIDHLVYTAGEELLLSPLAELDLPRARAFFELRYWGALAAVRAAHGHLARDGSIVLTGGTAGRRSPPGFVVGAAICAAMEATTRALAVELAPIRVNIVVPGFVDTGLWSNIPEAARTQMFADAAAKLPVGRIGTPADIAEHYLGFMRGGYVTGQSLVVDGGALVTS
ncbi:short-chain dehydrogenase/reductase SDR [Minicystis rosea]|nr:short-chain dehydrogenase/reductase SDR [Minicystis rosea]